MDISIIQCEGVDCPLRESCHRFVLWLESWGYCRKVFDVAPYSDGFCKYYRGL